MSNPSITADKTPWYQWDTGLTVTVSGGAMTECHFANRKQGTAYVQEVINGVARVPDELLQVAAPIKAYGYVSDGAGGQTYVEQTFEVIARNIPSDYTYTKTAQKTIRDAEVARDQAVQAAKDAKASELAADDSAVEASNSAQSAGESASAAATSASNAAKSAGDAATSASDAKAAADKAVEDASALLKTYTDNAKTSADNAATSASNAADAASAASDSASAAEQSATDANSAKVAAQTAKAEAEDAKSEAATSASNAAESATAAANSASDAAASVGAINVIAPKTIGTGAFAPSLSFSAGYGASCTENANYSVAIGNMANVTEIGSVAIGSSAISTASGAVSLGDNAKTNHRNSASIASHSETTKENEVSVGSAYYAGGEYTREITHVSTPTADSSASTKKYTDDNDAKTLSEAKKYTDANTSNALVGTVSGKLLHVEDAWPSKPLSLTIDGAYKQDGTPSPENPVPIEVVENPVLWMTGKNLQKYPFPYNHPKVDNLNGVIVTDNGDGSVTATGTPSIESYYNFDFTSDFTFARGNDVVVASASNPSYHVEVITDVGNSPVVNSVTKLTNKVPTDALKVRSFLVFTAGVNHNVTFFPQFETGTTATAYSPYVGTSLPINLPAEHPYLAKLPDGTADTIEIDRYGNAKLVARVGKTETAVTDCVNATVGTDALSSTGAIEDGATVYYKLATPVNYHLSKLDIPALPEAISNVWTDAELTTDMSMTYKRDINVAFDNLVQAVVAAAAGE